MGYTHYFKNKRAFTDAEWKAFTADVKKLLANTHIPIANGHAELGTKPVFNSKYITFNGVGADAHETACVTKEAQQSEFCKTARKPYDPLVVAFYKLIRKYDPNVELSSDGGDEVFDGVKIKVDDKWTYSAGDFDVKVGDTVMLPPTPYSDGKYWTGVVTSIGSDYSGYIKTIEGVVEPKKKVPVTNLEIVAGILEAEFELDTDLDRADRVAKLILNNLADRLENY